MRGRGSKRGEEGEAWWMRSILGFIKAAEFEILFFLFFFIAFLLFKDLTSRPQYNQILVKKPDHNFWPF